MRPEVVMVQGLSSGDPFSGIAGQQLIQEIASLDANSETIVSITTTTADQERFDGVTDVS